MKITEDFVKQEFYKGRISDCDPHDLTPEILAKFKKLKPKLIKQMSRQKKPSKFYITWIDENILVGFIYYIKNNRFTKIGALKHK